MTRTHSPDGILSHLFTDEDGGIVALHRGPAGNAILVGRVGEPLRSIPITAMRTLRDGGSVFAATAEGALDAPNRMGEPKVATWQGRALTSRLADAYDIDLSAPPTITRKGSAPRP
jgi:hypothetical protein